MDFHSTNATSSSSSSSSFPSFFDSSSSPNSQFSKKSFFSHVFSNSDESKAEFLNAIQYASMGIIPVVIINKSIQRFSPDADTDKPTIEILVEVFIQLIIMFCGVIVTHRMITYFPTYSGYKYEHLEITNIILAFLIIILSIQTKIGIKVNIIFDRALDVWNGTTNSSQKKKNGRGGGGGGQNRNLPNGVAIHSPSQADYLDIPSAPMASVKPNQGGYEMMRGSANGGGGGGGNNVDAYSVPIMAANSVLGSSFGSSFF